jgi:hypothetical protein
MAAIESHDLTQGRRRARIGYEKAQLFRGLIGAIPFAIFSLLSGFVTDRWDTAIALSCILALLVTLALWSGGGARRAVLPGSIAGLIPYSLAIAATAVGHVCVGSVCTGLCAPACALGGLLSGASLACFSFSKAHGVPFLFVASALALGVGSLGCSCVGLRSMSGLAAGLLIGTLPGIVHSLRLRRHVRGSVGPPRSVKSER